MYIRSRLYGVLLFTSGVSNGTTYKVLGYTPGADCCEMHKY